MEHGIDPDTFAAEFREADKKKPSSPEGLHYMLWKALAEREDFCKYLHECHAVHAFQVWILCLALGECG